MPLMWPLLPRRDSLLIFTASSYNIKESMEKLLTAKREPEAPSKSKSAVIDMLSFLTRAPSKLSPEEKEKIDRRL